jgi:hypothetical protein
MPANWFVRPNGWLIPRPVATRCLTFVTFPCVQLYRKNGMTPPLFLGERPTAHVHDVLGLARARLGFLRHYTLLS